MSAKDGAIPSTVQLRWDRLALVVWVATAAVLAFTAAARPQAHSVYGIYARASRDWWAGRDMYTGQGEPYRYSPVFAIGVTPFSLLPDWLGCPLWKLLSLAAYAMGLGLWAGRALPARLGRSEIGLMFLLVLPGSMHSMHIGQANLLMMATCLVAVMAATEERWWLAALAAAAATLIKGYPAALGLLLCALFLKRFTWRYLASLVLGLLLPFATQRPRQVMLQYVSWVGHLRASTTVMRERLRSLDHLLQLYGHPIRPRAFLLLGIVAGAAVFMHTLWYARRTTDRREWLTHGFLLFTVWVALFGPATETCTYAVATPAIAWILLERLQRCAPWTQLAAVASLLLMGPLVTDAVGTQIRNFANSYGSQPIGALLLAGCLLIRSVRTPAVAASPSVNQAWAA